MILTEIKDKKETITVIQCRQVGKKGDRIDKIMEEREMNKIIIGGDFNIRTEEIIVVA